MSTIAPRAVRLRDGREAVIRCAVEADATELLANLAAAVEEPFNVIAPGEMEKTLEEERQWIAEHREEPGRVAIVAEVDERVVGLLNFSRGPWRRLHHGGMFGMSVVADHRRIGLGDALVAALLAWAREEPGIEKIALAVFEENAPARALYEKHGFEVEGRRPRQVRLDDGTYADDLLMFRFVDG